MASFGITEAAQRARSWAPHLETEGQRHVLAWLVAFTGADGIADPSVRRGRDGEPPQLAQVTGYTWRATVRIITELESLGVIEAEGGRSKGRRPTRWAIQRCPWGHRSTVTPGSRLTDPTVTLGRANGDPGRSTTVTLESPPETESSEKAKSVQSRGRPGKTKDGSKTPKGKRELPIEEETLATVITGGHVPREDGKTLCGVKVKPDVEYRLAVDGRIPCGRCQRSWRARRAS